MEGEEEGCRSGPYDSSEPVDAVIEDIEITDEEDDSHEESLEVLNGIQLVLLNTNPRLLNDEWCSLS